MGSIPSTAPILSEAVARIVIVFVVDFICSLVRRGLAPGSGSAWGCKWDWGGGRETGRGGSSTGGGNTKHLFTENQATNSARPRSKTKAQGPRARLKTMLTGSCRKNKYSLYLSNSRNKLTHLSIENHFNLFNSLYCLHKLIRHQEPQGNLAPWGVKAPGFLGALGSPEPPRVPGPSGRHKEVQDFFE